MRNEIWATLFHKRSIDDNPQHDKCPRGEESWCSWQKARATGTLAGYKHKPSLLNEVFDAIKPIYEDLSSDDLLTLCVGGFTQNNNESFNATVWSMAPKSSSSEKTVLDIVAHIAVCVFNNGLSGLMLIMQEFGLKIGPECYDFCTVADAHRINYLDRSLSI